LTARAIDIAAGLRVLRGIGGEEAFAERYRGESQALRGAALAVTRVESGLAAIEVLMPGVIVSGVTFLAARFAFDGRLTVGELVAFYGYAAFLATPLRTLMEAADNMTRAHVAARRVVRILSLTAEIGDPEHPVSPPAAGSMLADEESGLEIEPGVLFAVACSEPEDAEALAARLSRFADSGRPTLGGVPLAQMRVADVRERVLLARNSDRFFTGTLREELDPSGRATEEEILAAIDAASTRDVIDALEDGLDTEVVDGGRTFSGGQLQRLRLARALLARREITILVEPTSAVDAHTEARIAENLSRSWSQSRSRAAGAVDDGSVSVLVDEAGGLAQRDERGRGRELGAGAAGAGSVDVDGSASSVLTVVPQAVDVDGSGALTAVPSPVDVDGSGPSALTVAPSVVDVVAGAAVGMTTVVFTTSPLLLDRAHRVAFVEAGHVVAVGTHRDLLATRPRYAAVVTREEDEG
jgi:ABC-type multidrug transport system fused ATPase/permease subunit